ncbi:hypothetical protein ACP4OV_003117 [Aristida adscensionis]
MAAAIASSDRGEVDTSRAFRSVKEAVAIFGERILAREAQFRPPNAGAHDDRRFVVREGNPKGIGVAIAAADAKLEGSDGAKAHGVRFRECHSKPTATYSAKQEGSSTSNTAPNLLPVQVQVPRPASDDVPMYLVPSSPPFFASSPSLANDDGEDDQERKEEEDLMVMSSIKKLEDEAARTRQEAAQLKKRLAEMELSMATLNAKLHRALSKLAHMEADKAAAARAGIERGRGDMALTVWAERRAPRQPLGHLMRLGDDAGGEVVTGGAARAAPPPPPAAGRRKVQKRKPIVPLIVPLISDMLFSKKRRMKDKESMYMKELYSLLRLS